MRLELNSMLGYFATSKKFGLRRSLSRASTRVSTEFTSIDVCTCDWVISFSLSTAVPVTLVKLPVTFEIARCRTVNCAVEWFGSIVQFEICANAEKIERRKIA